MKKFLSLFLSAAVVSTMISCDNDDSNNNNTTYKRDVVVATVNSAGTRTVYTSPTNVLTFTFDHFSREKAQVKFSEIYMPDNSVMKEAEVNNMQYKLSSTGKDFVFTEGKAPTFDNFTADTPVNVSAILSGVKWNNLGASNTSAEIEFASGCRLTAFGSALGFYTNATITDTQNPEAEAFKTFEATSNILYIIMSEYPKAKVYIYQAAFDESTTKKVDLVIEDVTFAINAGNGVLSLNIDEAIPNQMTNNITGKPMPEYKISNLQCTINADFSTPGTISFTCGDRYEFSAQLLETLSKDNL